MKENVVKGRTPALPTFTCLRSIPLWIIEYTLIRHQDLYNLCTNDNIASFIHVAKCIHV